MRHLGFEKSKVVGEVGPPPPLNENDNSGFSAAPPLTGRQNEFPSVAAPKPNRPLDTGRPVVAQGGWAV